MTDHAPIEVKWLWRRVFTFASSLAAYALVAWIIWKLTDAKALQWIGLALILLIAVGHAIYLTGATVTDWARLAAAARPGVKITPTGVTTDPNPAEGADQ